MAILIQTEELTKRFNKLLQPANQEAMLNAFDRVSKAATEIETIPRQLGPTLEKLPALTSEAQKTLAAVSKLSSNVSLLSNNLNGFTTSLQARDGAIAKFSNSAEQVGAMASRIEFETLPLAHDARSSLRAVDRTLDSFNQRSKSILFGGAGIQPGPGEPGFDGAAK